MSRNLKIASLATGAGLLTLPFGGVGAAIVGAVAGAMVGDNLFSESKRPWRELEEILKEGESVNLEFKEFLCENTKSKSAYDGIIKTVAAFANTDGGELLLGVSDKGATTGLKYELQKFSSADKFETAIHDALRNALDANIVKLYRLKFDTISDHMVCRIEVEKSATGNPVFTKQGIFHYRTGNRTIQLTTQEYDKLQKKASV